jgi:glycosyltransferase involved in cell wall biosynthesis
MESRITVDIALPVLNEAVSLEASVMHLLAELPSRCPYDWSLCIVDNGSTDSSWSIASRLARDEEKVRALRLGHRGRGGALKAAWASSEADILAYMDIDLSTDLSALDPLLRAIAQQDADVSIGSRLAPESEVTRSARREVISHVYNVIARVALRYRVRDAQCGFKAVSAEVARTVVPLVEDDSWFFDTELLVLAWRRGLRIHEVPVRWVEDDDSRVHIVNTARDDLRGIWRLLRDDDSAGLLAVAHQATPEEALETVPSIASPPSGPVGASQSGPRATSVGPGRAERGIDDRS